MIMKTKIYLYRHGETEENRRHILQGLMQGHLTEEGKRQIRESADSLAAMSVDLILCSDLKRCKDTAAIINKVLKVEIVETPLLRERDWGSATGMVVDGTHKIVIPDDAESVVNMKERARLFFDYVKKAYLGKTILAVSHGLFCRCLQAVNKGVELSDIIPMKNTEVRLIEI